MKINSTKEKILLEAESLIQKKGFNAFSFKDISRVIGIKTASIHYHFHSKEDLGIEVVVWHTEKISAVLQKIQNKDTLSLKEKMQALFEAVLSLTYSKDNKMCLGGMFASDFDSLPIALQNKIRFFFKTITKWIEDLLIENGYSKKSSLMLSKQIISQIEGALLLVRLEKDREFLEGASRCIDFLLT